MDSVKEDMQRVGVAEEDPTDRERWKQMIHYGDQLKEEEDAPLGIGTVINTTTRRLLLLILVIAGV